MVTTSGQKRKITAEADANSIMTATEVAAFLKVSVGAVRRWTRNGNLKGHRLGGKGDWRYLKGEIMAFLCGNDDPQE